MSSEQKLKEGDQILSEMESTNRAHLLFFTDRQQVYKSHAYDFDDTKASVMGDYVPASWALTKGRGSFALRLYRNTLVICCSFSGEEKRQKWK